VLVSREVKVLQGWAPWMPPQQVKPGRAGHWDHWDHCSLLGKGPGWSPAPAQHLGAAETQV